ncbi:SDR family oxidoreductase [Stenotrophomonas sp. MMGLT7]|uniref:SDR family NAD(P)-dependent oxidoreductase n=1 Tax=Stenotrophomonas sp. MMGLT7 TaxID=2901227 RepID=UPI001E2F3899|nr:SDR family oxidoreductase [Stenotrophomonas sp. MMGLT7]MCD7098801.1 SDR family oxidoreductase [Stenotrophomonas sp. MMGLT7]
MSGMLQPEVLVLGSGHVVTCGVVSALLEAGSPVLVVDRDPQALARMQAEYAAEPAFATLCGSVADEQAALALAARVAQRPRPLAAVVAHLQGPSERGRLLDRGGAALQRMLEHDLLPHLHAVRHLLPLLVEADLGGRYVMIGSPCALRAWSGHGARSVAAAATRMLAQVLHEEAQSLGVRVQSLSVEQPVSDPDHIADACPEWISALAVGRAAVRLIAGRGVPGKALVAADRQLASHPVAGLMNPIPFPLHPFEVSR